MNLVGSSQQLSLEFVDAGSSEMQHGDAVEQRVDACTLIT